MYLHILINWFINFFISLSANLFNSCIYLYLSSHLFTIHLSNLISVYQSIYLFKRLSADSWWKFWENIRASFSGRGWCYRGSFHGRVWQGFISEKGLRLQGSISGDYRWFVGSLRAKNNDFVTKVGPKDERNEGRSGT